MSMTHEQAERSTLWEALYADLDATLAEMPNVFTTHQFILKLAHRNQRAYVALLHDCRTDAGGPFEAVHRVIGRKLRSLADEGKGLELVEQHVRSVNIFGYESACALWRRKRTEEA